MTNGNGDGSRKPQEVRIVTRRLREFPDDSWTIERALDDGAYEAARKAVETIEPGELVDLVKESGLRGRGGAGFPTGMKWSFVPQDVFPKYVIVNHDEAEPGTFKDRELVESDPHQLLEGIIIAAWANQANTGFVYCRGEFALGSRRLARAIRDAYDRGFLGEGIFGSSFDLDVILHRGAGAYIAGEESALLDSLEGYRSQPRLRPPYPAVKGAYGKPTAVNNTETLSTLPAIVSNGIDWYKQWGTEKSPGTKMLSVSGHVNRPANYEVPMGMSLGDLIELAGGMRDGRKMKAVVPGGLSAPLVTDPSVGMDFESLKEAGTMLGSGGVIVMDETTCMVRNSLASTQFFEEESCGKCTPCREGTWWAVKVLERIEHGEGSRLDLDTLLDICDGMDGRSFCPLGDAAAWALGSNLTTFRAEFEAHVSEGRCPYGDELASLAGARERLHGVGPGQAGTMKQPASGVGVDSVRRAHEA